ELCFEHAGKTAEEIYNDLGNNAAMQEQQDALAEEHDRLMGYHNEPSKRYEDDDKKTLGDILKDVLVHGELEAKMAEARRKQEKIEAGYKQEIQDLKDEIQLLKN